MKKILQLIIFAICTVPVFAGVQEQMSAQNGSDGHKYDFDIVKTFQLKHKDGTILTFNLVKFNKTECITVENIVGCVGGFTGHESNNKRKFDPEKPVDTTETINLIFTNAKRPIVDEESFAHELVHASDYHWNSRTECETNWRYAECMESKAYDYTYLLKQFRQLDRQKLIKIINM